MKIAFVYMNNAMNIGRGAGYVASAIVGAGHEVFFFDTVYAPLEKITYEIVNNDFDLIMISSVTMLFSEAIRLIRIVKKQHNMPVLVGGVHVTIMGKEILEQFNEIDYVCLGEGESMVVDFLRSYGTDSLYDVKNLAYRRDGRVFANPIRPPEDLAKLPSFPWNYFPKESIVQKSNGFLYVTASRGCPYNCTYCSNGVYLKHYGRSYLRFKPISQIIAELTYLKSRYSPRLFYFGDEMILHDVENAVNLFEAIKEEVNVPYGFMGRVEYMTEELVGVLVKTGCQYVAMGIECGNEEFRVKYLNRRMSDQQIEYAFSLLKNANIFTTSFNMIGFPFEHDDFLTNETIKLNKRINPDLVQVSIFYPFPGTPLYKRCVDLDIIDPLKQKNITRYFNESVLKGVLMKRKLDEINRIFNPKRFQFPIKNSFFRRSLEYLRGISVN
jgi:anaerobic magnesium-protoporphyrin IX monomethyl ester cyclase